MTDLGWSTQQFRFAARDLTVADRYVLADANTTNTGAYYSPTLPNTGLPMLSGVGPFIVGNAPFPWGLNVEPDH